MSPGTLPGAPAPASPPAQLGDAYARYVLGVLVLVYVLNFVDRQIPAILNDHIKADLGLSDAQMGFLYGTAFAVFYALFGIPLGRLADVWTRRSLIALGLVFWSAMTALSGLAQNFTQLAAARIGVGIGEASASPAAYSLLSDCFPPARRATVLAIYSSGIYLGAGLSLALGGLIVDRWDAAYAHGPTPFGLRGWQVAFLAVGLPGLALAVLVRTLREPVRGQADGIPTAPEPHPFREFFRELRAVLPPLTLWNLARSGAGARSVVANLTAAALLAAAAFGLVRLTGDPAQWVALAIGLYAAFSWTQSLALRDRPAAALILGTPSLRWAALGFALIAFTGYGFGQWLPPFFLRFHSVSIAELGLVLGGTVAVSGFLGVTFGGVVADRWRERSKRGRLYVGMLTAVLPAPFVVWLLLTPSTSLAYAIVFPLNLISTMYLGVGASTVQDLVLPRMRAVASAAYIMVITFVGLALGPYTIGVLSDFFGSLRTALLSVLVVNLLACAALGLSAWHLERDETTLRTRARQAGERDVLD